MVPGLSLVALLSTSLEVGEGFALPACEPAGPWAPALALAGFAPGSGPVSLDACGEPWVLTVADDAGHIHRVTVTPARTGDAREDLALLARSLRQGSRAPGVATRAPAPAAVAEPLAERGAAIVAPAVAAIAAPVHRAATATSPTLVVAAAPEEAETAMDAPADIGPIDLELASIGMPGLRRPTDDAEPLLLALPVIIPTFEASPAAPRAAPAIAAALADAQREAAQRKERNAAVDEARAERLRAEKDAAAAQRIQRKIARQVEDARVDPPVPRQATPLGPWGVAGVGFAAASDRGAGPMAEVAGGLGRHGLLLLGGSFAATLPTALVGFGDGRTTHAVGALATLGVEPVRFGGVSIGVGAARRWFAQDGTAAGAAWLPQVGASLEAHSSVHRAVDLRARIGGRYDLQTVSIESGGTTLGTLSPLELTLAVGVGR